MRARTGVVGLVVLALVLTGCYQDLDFSGDHKADRVVTDLHGAWLDLETGIVLFEGGSYANAPVPGDWNGDHLADAAVVTPDGQCITRSARGTFTFPPPPTLPGYASHPSLTNLPVPGDYDGDGDLDPAWYRESDGTWFIEGRNPVTFGHGPSAETAEQPKLGTVDYDLPVPADYDGDGIDDLAVYRPRSGDWTVRSSSTGTDATVRLPGQSLLSYPVPADYDGVGHAQRAVFGPTGWIIEGHPQPDPFGAEAMADMAALPAPADYDGDDRTDLSYIDLRGGDDLGRWYTKGEPEPVIVQSPNWDQWALATGWTLRWNVARLTFLAQCIEAGPDC